MLNYIIFLIRVATSAERYCNEELNFGEYIEDILTRILYCEDVDASFLPCDYVRHFEDGTDAEVTKPSQAIA